MVWHLSHLHPLLRRLQGPGSEPQRPALLLPSATLCRLVRPVHVLHRLSRTSFRMHTVLPLC